MATGTKETVGTEITLFLNEESTEFANEYCAREIIENTALSCQQRFSYL